MEPEPLRTLRGAPPAFPLTPLALRLYGSALLFLEVVPLEKGSEDDAGELKGEATGICGRAAAFQALQSLSRSAVNVIHWDSVAGVVQLHRSRL